MKLLHLQQWKCYTYLYQLTNSDLNGHQRRQTQHLSAYYPAMALLHLSTKSSTTYLGVQNTRKRTVREKTRKSTIKRKQRGLGIFLKWPDLSFFEAQSEWLFWELNDPSSIYLSAFRVNTNTGGSFIDPRGFSFLFAFMQCVFWTSLACPRNNSTRGWLPRSKAWRLNIHPRMFNDVKHAVFSLRVFETKWFEFQRALHAYLAFVLRRRVILLTVCFSMISSWLFFHPRPSTSPGFPRHVHTCVSCVDIHRVKKRRE